MTKAHEEANGNARSIHVVLTTQASTIARFAADGKTSSSRRCGIDFFCDLNLFLKEGSNSSSQLR